MNALVLTSSPAISDCKIVSVETIFVLEKFGKGSCIRENFFSNPRR